MARPMKCRKVCDFPKNTLFFPKSEAGFELTEKVTMTVDEYETLRLIDLLQLTQEECSKKMNVARTTVQLIYVTARKKMADCIVNGKKLQIKGGRYYLCKGQDVTCRDSCAYKIINKTD